MVRILLVNTSEHTGGAAVAANRLMAALRKNGVKTKMLVRDKTTDDINVVSLTRSCLWQKFLFCYERLIIFVANLFSRKNLFAIDVAMVGNDITQTDEFQEADIIHLHWVNQGMMSLSSIKAVLKSGKPVVWTMHDMWPCTGICHYARQCESYHTGCHNCMYLRFPALNDLSAKSYYQKQKAYSFGKISFVACSKWLRKEAEKSALMKGHNLLDIPNPIDTGVFCPKSKKISCDELGLPIDRKLVLFCSVKITDERKGFSYFVNCCNSLKKSGMNIGVVLLGTCSEDLSSAIPFETYSMGYISDSNKLAKVYNAVDLFVTPSLEDNLPNTIMEAMACGTPCVGFEVGGIPEMIDHRKNGYVARYCDAADMAHGIEWCLDETDYGQLSDEALHKVHRCYSQDAVANKYIKLYNELLNNEE